MPDPCIPVITLDGPSGSGKGTIGQILAQRLGWRFLDSGALYRLVALAAQNDGVALDDEAGLAKLATYLDAEFKEDAIFLENSNVTLRLRSEECGNAASRIATLPPLRRALLERQRAFRTAPGLVADGRDMGTVVFPDAPLKVFLTASADERARRRYKQLLDRGMDASMTALVSEINARDARDATRELAPMKPAPDALVLDSSDTEIEEVVQSIINLWRNISREKFP